MQPPTSKQFNYLTDLERKHGDVFIQVRDTADEGRLKGRSIASLSRTEASTLISAVVSALSEGKEGKDRLDEAKQHEDQGNRRKNDDGNGLEGQGNGQGDGEGQGQGQGEGEGQGQGEGQGNGDNNQEDNQMRHEYREGSKQQIVADSLIKNNMNEIETFGELRDQLGNKPLEFTQRDGNGGREPLPMGSPYDNTNTATQNGRLRKLIRDTRNALEQQHKQQDGNQNENRQQQQDGKKDGQQQKQQESEADYFYRTVCEWRELVKTKNADGRTMVEWGMRQLLNGGKALSVGFPAQQQLDAITMDWPDELRREAMGKAFPPFDVTKLWKSEQEPGKHKALPALKRLALAGVPIYLYGPAGSGKTTLAKQLNDVLNKQRGTNYEFGFASMTSGTSPGEFKGRITLDGFLPSLFEQIFTEGGVFLFDEIDAGDENLLTLLHAALANGYFINNKGQKLYKHKHFVAVAAGNTLGLGANTNYVGRSRLDGATLDRFCNGRVRIDLDRDLERHLYYETINGDQQNGEIDVEIVDES